MFTSRCLVSVVTLILALTFAANAQFAAGMQAVSTQFHDPDGRFTLTVPAGWTYQPDESEPDFYVFFGPGSYDLFYLEVFDLPDAGATPIDLAYDTIEYYSGPYGLEDFQIVVPPTPGELGGKPAAFLVFSDTDIDGTPIIEGRAITIHGGKELALAFADHADLFEASTPTFNAVMASLELHETASASTDSSADYTSPDGHFTFLPPDGWELWEEQSTRRGDQIEPWHTLFEWPSRPMSKSLFIWDYFDEWEQVGAQYEIVLAVIDNVPGALNQSIETLVRQIAGTNAHIYTASNSRARIGNQTGMAVEVVARPGMVEPWSLGVPWFREHTFYVIKQGVTLFVWAVPSEIVDMPEVAAALESFRWVAR